MMFLKMFLKSKKAQLTIFIIIGIMLLISAGIYFYLTSRVVPEEDFTVEQIPVEARPIQEFTQECLNRLGVEALKKLGQHGGYIDYADAELSRRSFDVDVLDPTESDAFSISNSPQDNIIYWWYMITPNECQDCIATNENIPALEDLEHQTRLYIERNLDSCLQEFKSFDAAGFDVVQTGERTVNVMITENDVMITMLQPTSVSIGDRTTEVSRFITRVPLRLKQIYELANELVEAEVKDEFIETITLNFISLASGLDTNRLPPFYASETSYSKRIWIKSVVDQQIKNILVSRIPQIQFDKTKGAAPFDIGTEYDTSSYDLLYRRELNNSYPDFTARFTYLNQPTYFEITPSDGDTLSYSQRIPRELNFLGLISFGVANYQNYYEFFYDLSFPVMVEITSTSDLRGEPYTFRFGIEANIRDNRDLRDWIEGRGTIGPWDSSRIELGTSAEAGDEEGNLGNSFVRKPTKTLFCSPKQRLSGNITIKTTWNNGSAIEDVKVKYGCGYLPACEVGSTELNDEGETILVTTVPLCFGGGYLEFERDGILTKKITDITTEQDVPQEFEIALQELKVFDVVVKKLKMNREIIYRDPTNTYQGNYEKEFTPGSRVDSDPLDQFIIKVTRIDDRFDELLGEQQLILDPSIEEPSLKQIKLVPGIYEIEATNLRKEKINIEPEYRCRTQGENCYWSPEPPGIEMGIFLSGGFHLNVNSSYWVVSASDLKRGNAVEFTTFEFPFPVITEDMGENSNVFDLSILYRDRIDPKIVKINP